VVEVWEGNMVEFSLEKIVKIPSFVFLFSRIRKIRHDGSTPVI
jgi:hypothetical protein